ncbi:MAG: thioesterase family protein [Acidobacteriota bacterium]
MTAAVDRFQTRRRIEFSDTDLAGIVHFSRFYVFMESAEHEFLRSIGTSVHTEIDGHQIGWPRLSASCDFFRPVRFEDWLDLEVLVERKGTKSMTYRVFFRHDDDLVARGRIASACCVLQAGERPRAIAIPAQIADRFEQCPAEDLKLR